jgi:hypothetical protein
MRAAGLICCQLRENDAHIRKITMLKYIYFLIHSSGPQVVKRVKSLANLGRSQISLFFQPILTERLTAFCRRISFFVFDK